MAGEVFGIRKGGSGGGLVAASALTAGSVLFADSAGKVAQDNTNFFWDDSNDRLGLGINTPSTTLHVVGVSTLAGAVNVSGAETISTNGASAVPPLLLSGTWFTGGGTTNTKPTLLVEPTGATTNNWSNSGTGLGINAPSGFAGNLLDLQLNGAARMKVSSVGLITSVGLTSSGGNVNFDAGAFFFDTATARLLLGGAAGTPAGAVEIAAGSDVSLPALILTGAFGTGGTTTTDFPHFLIQPAGATAATTWSTDGTAFGINANLAQGNLVDWRVDGAIRFQVSHTGAVVIPDEQTIKNVSGYGLQISSNAGGIVVMTGAFFQVSPGAKLFCSAGSGNYIQVGDTGTALTTTYFATAHATLGVAAAAGAVLATFTPGAHTALASDINDLLLSDHSVTLASTTTIASISSVVLGATTFNGINGGGDEIVTAAYTLDVKAPVQGTNLTLTRGWSIRSRGALFLSNAGGDQAVVVDGVSLSSYDLSAGNATLAIGTETAVVVEAVTSDATLSVRINGTTYKICLKS